MFPTLTWFSVNYITKNKIIFGKKFKKNLLKLSYSSVNILSIENLKFLYNYYRIPCINSHYTLSNILNRIFYIIILLINYTNLNMKIYCNFSKIKFMMDLNSMTNIHLMGEFLIILIHQNYILNFKGILCIIG